MGNMSISCCRSRSPSQLQASLDHHKHLNQNNNKNCPGDSIEGQYSSYARQSCSLFNGNIIPTCKQQSGSSSKRNSYDQDQHPCNILQHISEREPDDSETDPSSNPLNKPIFATRSRTTTNSHATPRTKQLHQPSQTGIATTPCPVNDSCNPIEGGCLSNTQVTYTPLNCSQMTDYGYNSATSTNLNPTSCSGGATAGADQSSLIIYDSINSSNTSAILHSKQPLAAVENNQQILNNSLIGQSLSDSHKLSLMSTTTINTSNELANSLASDEEDEDKENESSDERSGSVDTATSTTFLSGNSGLGVGYSGNTLRNHDRRKFSSCSTIFIDGSTISKPNLEQTMRYVSLAIYYHIKNRRSDTSIGIFDETIHPLSKLSLSNNTSDGKENNFISAIEQKSLIDPMSDCPSQKAIYKFVKTLIKAAQLTAEYAITTLVYLERLMTYGEMDLTPKTWRRMFLGAILLSSKVWEDQAVWNVDYAQILDEISVDDINELERQFLELIQFNMNVPSPVYAKYYFDLRTLASTGRKTNLLSVRKARALEAMSRISSADLPSSPVHRKPEPERKRHSSLERLRENGRAPAILM